MCAFHVHTCNGVELDSSYSSAWQPAGPARRAMVSARASTPRPMSSGEEYSSGRWLTPPRQGMKIIAVGAMLAMKRESWYARLTIFW
mmetsp:Transcript_30760/g.86960  ORF Transcript_30760/g.86960 Transcript_30760/m.86960 type:complete len:87 (+) Transcript_30760:242-502(+)